MMPNQHDAFRVRAMRNPMRVTWTGAESATGFKVVRASGKALHSVAMARKMPAGTRFFSNGAVDGIERYDETGAEEADILYQPATPPSPAAVVRVREYFPETLAWLPEIVTDDSGFADVTIPAADSITSWRLSLLANTRDGQMGSADIPYKVFQDFFIDLDLPVQLTIGDTLQLPVAVHNYAKTAQTVTLTLDAREGITPDGADKREITLAAGEVGKVVFPLKATAAGHGQITVKAVSPTP